VFVIQRDNEILNVENVIKRSGPSIQTVGAQRGQEQAYKLLSFPWNFVVLWRLE